MRHALAVAAFVGLTVAPATAAAQAPPADAKRVETTEKGQKTEQVAEKDLPKPVFDAIHAHRRAIFVSAVKVTTKSGVEYHITVRGSRKTAMVAKPDGTVLSFK